MDDIVGFHKNPLVEPTNQHFKQFKERVIPNEWVKYSKNTDFIREISARLDDFTKAIFDENGEALFGFLEWIFSSIKSFKNDLHLDNPKFWDRERGELYTYSHYLRQYAEMNRFACQIQNRALIFIWSQLRSTAVDLARAIESSLEKWV